MGRNGHTLQLEQHALASGDLCASLAHALERPGHLLLVAARHAVREHVHIVPVLEQVQGGLENTDVGLARDQPRSTGRDVLYLDAHEDEGLEPTFANEGEEVGRCH